MIAIFQRHPRFAITCAFGFLCLFLLQASRPGEGGMGRLYGPRGPHGDVDVAWRLRKSEDVYQKMVREVGCFVSPSSHQIAHLLHSIACQPHQEVRPDEE